MSDDTDQNSSLHALHIALTKAHATFASDSSAQTTEPHDHDSLSAVIDFIYTEFDGGLRTSSHGVNAAAIYTLIETCKLNRVDARAWLVDVLTRINDHPMHQLDDLLSWNWKAD